MLNSHNDNIIAAAYLQVIKNNRTTCAKLILEEIPDQRSNKIVELKKKRKEALDAVKGKEVQKKEGQPGITSDIDQNLINSCYNGQYDEVKVLLIQGADINTRDLKTNKTPLTAAITTDNLKIIDLLIQNQVDVNAVDSENVSPLMLSCNLGKFDIIKKLLSQEDIQVNTQENYTGYTALMIVLDSNMLDVNQKEEIAKLLVDKSTNLNIKDEQYGLTAIDRTNENELLNIKKILTIKGGLSSEELDKE